MAINKVVINEDGKENILIDITDSTVEPETLAEGAVAYNRSGDKIVGTMTAGGGSVDWADIENNPFDGKGDIVSWANAGIDVSTIPCYSWVKVSDAVVAIEEIIADGQFIDGADLTWYSADTVVSTAETSNFPAYGASDNWYVDCTEMNNGDYIALVNFRSDGVYFSKYEGFDGNLTYPLSITLPNINKFTVVKQIETKYLPESIQLETVTLSDSLEINPIFDDEWMADHEALAAVEGWYRGYRRITDYSIPMESGVTSWVDVYNWGECEDEYSGHCTLMAYKNEGNHRYTLVIIDENGNAIDWGYYIPDGVDVGLYIDPWYAGTITSTIGAVFQIKTPKPIDKKYLPDDIGGMPEVTEADNGKFLRVVDGAWSAVAVPNAEGVGF